MNSITPRSDYWPQISIEETVPQQPRSLIDAITSLSAEELFKYVLTSGNIEDQVLKSAIQKARESNPFLIQNELVQCRNTQNTLLDQYRSASIQAQLFENYLLPRYSPVRLSPTPVMAAIQTQIDKLALSEADLVIQLRTISMNFKQATNLQSLEDHDLDLFLSLLTKLSLEPSCRIS